MAAEATEWVPVMMFLPSESLFSAALPIASAVNSTASAMFIVVMFPP